MNTLFFADEQVITPDNEDDLQRDMYKLNEISKLYSMKVSMMKHTPFLHLNGKILEELKLL